MRNPAGRQDQHISKDVADRDSVVHAVGVPERIVGDCVGANVSAGVNAS
jgi:hypothetical protein